MTPALPLFLVTPHTQSDEPSIPISLTSPANLEKTHLYQHPFSVSHTRNTKSRKLLLLWAASVPLQRRVLGTHRPLGRPLPHSRVRAPEPQGPQPLCAQASRCANAHLLLQFEIN